MNRVLKTFLLWLLIAVLPVQGFAAAMKASCGPDHHDSLLMGITAEQHEHHAEGRTTHHHDGDANVYSTTDASMPDAGIDADDHAASYGKHKSSYCSACAACCIGAVAPPSSFNLIPVFNNTEVVVVTPPQLVTGYIPAGLERPPRHISA